MVWAMATTPYARSSGAGSAVAGGIDAGALRTAAATMAASCLPLLWFPSHGALALLGAALGALAMRAWYMRRLGGYTGDCLGAVQQFAELGFLLGLIA